MERAIGGTIIEILDDVGMDIAGLPDAGPHWIPVTERLPEDDEMCLAYTDAGTQIVLQFFGGYWNASSNGHGNAFEDGIVIAWMPLPEPYRRRAE